MKNLYIYELAPSEQGEHYVLDVSEVDGMEMPVYEDEFYGTAEEFEAFKNDMRPFFVRVLQVNPDLSRFND